MVRNRFLRTAAIALALYGVLGLFISAAMLVVGITTFTQIGSLQKTLEAERGSLVDSIRTVSGTIRDTAGATTSFQQSVASARTAADQASKLANDSAGSFRDLGARTAALNVFGIQPLAGLAPQFSTGADQLQQLAVQLGATRDALSQNAGDIGRIGGDLSQLQTQLDAVAVSLNQPGVLGWESQSLLPFQVAFFGMCLLVIVQSGFCLALGLLLWFRVPRSAFRVFGSVWSTHAPVTRVHAHRGTRNA
jgi:hypothetical protein